MEPQGPQIPQIGTGMAVFWLAFLVLMIVSGWKIFAKAGKPGWAIIVPIYNVIVLLQICGRPIWWIVLFLVPIVNLVIAIIITVDLAKAFGHGIGFAVGLMLAGIVFYPLLAFDSSPYLGRAGAPPAPAAA